LPTQDSKSEHPKIRDVFKRGPKNSNQEKKIGRGIKIAKRVHKAQYRVGDDNEGGIADESFQKGQLG